MKNTKKVGTIILVATLAALTFVGCGDSTNKAGKPSEESSKQETSVVSVEESSEEIESKESSAVQSSSEKLESEDESPEVVSESESSVESSVEESSVEVSSDDNSSDEPLILILEKKVTDDFDLKYNATLTRSIKFAYTDSPEEFYFLKKDTRVALYDYNESTAQIGYTYGWIITVDSSILCDVIEI